MATIARSPKQISQAIQRRRKQLQLTQMDLSKKTGLSQKTLSNLEVESAGVKLKTLMDVLAALDLEMVIQKRSRAAKNIEDIF